MCLAMTIFRSCGCNTRTCNKVAQMFIISDEEHELIVHNGARYELM
jgi:hypothetical protein